MIAVREPNLGDIIVLGKAKVRVAGIPVLQLNCPHFFEVLGDDANRYSIKWDRGHWVPYCQQVPTLEEQFTVKIKTTPSQSENPFMAMHRAGFAEAARIAKRRPQPQAAPAPAPVDPALARLHALLDDAREDYRRQRDLVDSRGGRASHAQEAKLQRLETRYLDLVAQVNQADPGFYSGRKPKLQEAA